MKESKNEIILFENQGVKLEVNLKEETVWLTQAQMEELFDVKHATISEHINNIFKEGELDEKTSVGISDKSTGGRKSKIYNLDVIISVGYRVKSKNGVIFRQWANRTLKDYMLKGYAVNTRRLEYLEKTIDNNTLTALTLLIAESNPKEKDIITDLVMNFLSND